MNILMTDLTYDTLSELLTLENVEQTPEICLAAITQNENALQYVKKQIP